MVVAHEILVSAQGPLVLSFGVLGFGGFGVLGPGLDNLRSGELGMIYRVSGH